MKFLIVDDSEEIRSTLRRILEELRHVVVGEAENGKEALDMISETDPEVVLLDVSMPVMGGFATASELKRIAPELPVVFVSQHAGAEYVAEAFRLGARGYVLKAAIYSELDEAIESVQRNELYRSARLAS